MFTPLKWALPWSAPPTVPGVPAQASRPARPCPTSQRTRPLMVSPAPARTPVASSRATRAIADEHDDAADAAVADEHVRAAAERRDARRRARGRLRTMATSSSSLRASTSRSAAPPTLNVVSGASGASTVDAAGAEACLELGGARLERGRGHRGSSGTASPLLHASRLVRRRLARAPSASSSFSWTPSKPPFDMTTTRSPDAASRATVSTMSAVDVGGTRVPALGRPDRRRAPPATAGDPRRPCSGTPARRPPVRALERLDEVALEHLQARRRGARLEDRPDAPGRVREAQRGDASRRRRSDGARSRRRPRCRRPTRAARGGA